MICLSGHREDASSYESEPLHFVRPIHTYIVVQN